jgi:hypothetical protein
VRALLPDGPLHRVWRWWHWYRRGCRGG